jgi:hypothetical protein
MEEEKKNGNRWIVAETAFSIIKKTYGEYYLQPNWKI